MGHTCASPDWDPLPFPSACCSATRTSRRIPGLTGSSTGVTDDATLTPQQMRGLVAAAAAALTGVISPTVLDHAIWRSEAERQATDGKES